MNEGDDQRRIKGMMDALGAMVCGGMFGSLNDVRGGRDHSNQPAGVCGKASNLGKENRDTMIKWNIADLDGQPMRKIEQFAGLVEGGDQTTGKLRLTDLNDVRDILWENGTAQKIGVIRFSFSAHRHIFGSDQGGANDSADDDRRSIEEMMRV